jgi:hypothetical protein
MNSILYVERKMRKENQAKHESEKTQFLFQKPLLKMPFKTGLGQRHHFLPQSEYYLQPMPASVGRWGTQMSV